MNGTILDYNVKHDRGFVLGADGKRYAFQKEDLIEDLPVFSSVNFSAIGSSAKIIRKSRNNVIKKSFNYWYSRIDF